MAGTLVQAPVRQQAREPQPPPAAAPGSGKQQQQQQGQGQQQGQQQQGQQQAGAFGPGVGVIRLDRLAADRWPGWQASMQGVARVAPYQPAPASPPVLMPAGDGGGRGAPLAALALAPAGEGGRLELVPDLLRYDLTRLGGGFQAVLLNAGPASLARLAAGDWRLPRAALASGLLFVWAAKAQVAAGVRLMAASGFAYVENLTHVLLGPDGHPLQVGGCLRLQFDEAALVCPSADEAGSACLLLKPSHSPMTARTPPRSSTARTPRCSSGGAAAASTWR